MTEPASSGSLLTTADTAKGALKDILAHLQLQVLGVLKIHWQQDTLVDFTMLQDLSDSSQDKAILVLMQLQQRLITSGPLENLKPPPLLTRRGSPTEGPQSRQTHGHPEANTTYNYGYPSPAASAHEVPYTSLLSPSDGTTYPESTPHVHFNESQQHSSSPFNSESPRRSPTQARRSPQPAPPITYPRSSERPTMTHVHGSYERSPERNVRDSFYGTYPIPSDGSWLPPPAYQDHKITPSVTTTITGGGVEKDEKGHFASVTKVKLFGTRSKATPITISKNRRPAIQELEAPIPPKHPGRTLRKEQPQTVSPPGVQRMKENQAPPPSPASIQRRFSLASGTTAETSYEPPETPDFTPWDRSLPATPATGRTFSTPSRASSGSIRRARTQTSIASSPSNMNPRDFLPCEANKYQGFCKGAWRAQIGDRKKAMDDRQRPGGMFNAARFWQCSKCQFEGRLVMLDKKTKAVDRRVLTAEGLQFRWEFLFKSHVEKKDMSSDFLSAAFGCMFCTAEGRGTPTFGGAQMLMAHLQEHREKLPTGEVLYRMNAITGPRAPLEEDFDINIIAKDGVAI